VGIEPARRLVAAATVSVIVAIDEFVAIIVDAVIADLAPGNTFRQAGTIAVITVAEAVTVIVDSVVADLISGRDTARALASTVRHVVAVDQSVAVVVRAVVADLSLGVRDARLGRVAVVAVLIDTISGNVDLGSDHPFTLAPGRKLTHLETGHRACTTDADAFRSFRSFIARDGLVNVGTAAAGLRLTGTRSRRIAIGGVRTSVP
jgi:hypothetical protein